MFNVLLRNGTVVDGSGRSRYVADVGIEDGKITAIGHFSDAEAVEVYDVTGLVVAPGFIDAHSHSDLILFERPEAPEKLKQGITTEVLGQDGLSLAPIHSGRRKLLQDYTRPLTGPFTGPWDWTTLDDYLNALARLRPSINVCSYAGHNTVRIAVMGFEPRAPQPHELDAMRRLLHAAMEQGAVGMSSGLMYQPGSFSATDELVGLAEVTARFGGVHTSHIRSESDQLMASLQEMVEIGRRSGVWTSISHLKVSGRAQWGQASEAMPLLEVCADEGCGGTFDQYPYTAGNTMLASLLPPWVLAGGMQEMVTQLASVSVRDRIRRDYETGHPGWDSIVRAVGWSNLMLNSTQSDDHQELTGLMLSDIADRWDKDPVDALCDLLIAAEGSATMIIFQQSEEDLRTIMRGSRGMFCTDGIFAARPHPRLTASFPRVLGRYVREEKVLTLEEAVHKLSGLPAQTLHLPLTGFVAEGMWADLVVFDPATVGDTATYQHPFAPNTGIDHVLVSGRFAVKDGVHRGTRSGRVIRRAT